MRCGSAARRKVHYGLCCPCAEAVCREVHEGPLTGLGAFLDAPREIQYDVLAMRPDLRARLDTQIRALTK